MAYIKHSTYLLDKNPSIFDLDKNKHSKNLTYHTHIYMHTQIYTQIYKSNHTVHILTLLYVNCFSM